MRNLSIRVKLMVFSGAAILLLLVVAASGWLVARSVGEHLVSLSGERLPSIINPMRMRTWQLVSISENRNAMSFDAASCDSTQDEALAVNEGNAFFGDVLKTRLDADVQTQTYFGEYANLPKTAEELKKWQSLQSDWKVYPESNAAATVKYDSENTGSGFKTVAVVPMGQSDVPTTCAMTRPPM